MPGFTWLDDSADHSEMDEAKCKAIAQRISTIQHNEEQERFIREFDMEDGRYYNPCEDCECSYCLLNDGLIKSSDNDLSECATAKSQREEKLAKNAERELELNWLHAQLEQRGARLMRPYEHWNEDEAYMQYMENRD